METSFLARRWFAEKEVHENFKAARHFQSGRDDSDARIQLWSSRLFQEDSTFIKKCAMKLDVGRAACLRSDISTRRTSFQVLEPEPSDPSDHSEASELSEPSEAKCVSRQAWGRKCTMSRRPSDDASTTCCDSLSSDADSDMYFEAAEMGLEAKVRAFQLDLGCLQRQPPRFQRLVSDSEWTCRRVEPSQPSMFKRQLSDQTGLRRRERTIDFCNG
mmetsp:Transcript_26935/g.48690  ORF Transcript_26935/g.48690 Transcript_26935/m.48690 type:complete len:216 (-) Transcript_26935:65-712(-)